MIEHTILYILMAVSIFVVHFLFITTLMNLESTWDERKYLRLQWKWSNMFYECSSCHRYARGYQVEKDKKTDNAVCSCGGSMRNIPSYPWMDVHDEFPVLSLSEFKHCQRFIENQKESRVHLEMYKNWSQTRVEGKRPHASIAEDDVIRLLNIEQKVKVLNIEEVRKHFGYPIIK